MAQMALRRILVFDAVSTIIPGGENPQQFVRNTAVTGFPPLDDANTPALAAIYEEQVKPLVHHRW